MKQKSNKITHTITFNKKLKCFCVLIDKSSTINLQLLLNPNVKFTYLIQYQLVDSFVMKTFKNLLTDCEYVISDCISDIFFNTQELIHNHFDEYVNKQVNILQINEVLHNYMEYRSLGKDMFIHLLSKNKFDWESYCEYNPTLETVEIYAPLEDILINMLHVVNEYKHITKSTN